MSSLLDFGGNILNFPFDREKSILHLVTDYRGKILLHPMEFRCNLSEGILQWWDN
jgi:hypothetical protein